MGKQKKFIEPFSKKFCTAAIVAAGLLAGGAVGYTAAEYSKELHHKTIVKYRYNREMRQTEKNFETSIEVQKEIGILPEYFDTDELKDDMVQYVAADKMKEVEQSYEYDFSTRTESSTARMGLLGGLAASAVLFRKRQIERRVQREDRQEQLEEYEKKYRIEQKLRELSMLKAIDYQNEVIEKLEQQKELNKDEDKWSEFTKRRQREREKFAREMQKCSQINIKRNLNENVNSNHTIS